MESSARSADDRCPSLNEMAFSLKLFAVAWSAALVLAKGWSCPQVLVGLLIEAAAWMEGQACKTIGAKINSQPTLSLLVLIG